MREKMYHHDLKDIFLFFGRNSFSTASFFNFAVKKYVPNTNSYKHQMTDGEASDLLKSLIRKRLILSEYDLQNKNIANLQFNKFTFTERWRISGKGILELYEIFKIEEPVDSDYAEAAHIELMLS